MQGNDYWSTALSKRISRRRALVTTAGGAAAAAFLAACGGSDKSSVPATPGSSLLDKPSDTTAKAVRGGVLVRQVLQDPPDFDPLAGALSTGGRTIWVYSRLLKDKVAKYPARVDGGVEPDAAESFEISPDAMQITLKLRSNLLYDKRAPTNGRAMTSADVKFSWDKFAAKHPSRSDVANAVTPDAPIVGVTTPDDKTAIFKLAYPYAPITDLLAWPTYIQLEPREADGGFDPRKDTRGSGAWFIDEYRPSAYVHYRRNPDWYLKDRPYLDGVDEVIIPEYAAALAQLKAGNLWTLAVNQEDVLTTKRDAAKLSMQQATNFTTTVPNILTLGYNPGSPFLDERVRQAVSMLIDRDQWMKTFYNLDQFEKEGLQVGTRWNTMISPGEEKFWLDPHAKDFGDAAKYYMFNPAEAKKLLSASGVKTPVETPYTYTINGYGLTYTKSAEVLRGMIESDGDFKFKVQGVDYQGVFRYGFSNAPGTYDGMAPTPTSPKANVDQFIFAAYHSKGSRIKTPFGDPKVDDFIIKQRAETNDAKRVQLVQDLQRYLASKMYSIPFDGQSLGFTLAWPWLANNGVYSSWAAGDPQEALTYLWYDASKKNL